MLIPPFLKVNCAANVPFFHTLTHFGFVYYVALVAIVFNRAVFFLAALAVASTFFFLACVAFEHFLVVSLDDLMHIFGTRV